MQMSGYERGYQQARADHARGWWHHWLQARELADDAVYAPLGLSEEQRGYVAFLDELNQGNGTALPSRVAEPMRLLDSGPNVAGGKRLPARAKRVPMFRRLPGRLAKRLRFYQQKNRQGGKEGPTEASGRGMA